MAGLSVKLPLFLSKVDGAYGLNKTLPEVVKQNLKMLMLTIPGERIMIPDFGVGIPMYLFEPNTPELRSMLLNRMQEQIDKYLPFIATKQMTVDAADPLTGGEHKLVITIRYLIEPLGEEDILNMSLPEI